jgi:hypothetical protein
MENGIRGAIMLLKRIVGVLEFVGPSGEGGMRMNP